LRPNFHVRFLGEYPPAEDATREWITIEVEKDKNSEIARILENRFSELKLRQKILDLIRFQRMYSNGGLLYFAINENVPLTASRLNSSIPDKINKLEFINVIDSENFSVYQETLDPLANNFMQPKINVFGNFIHESRYSWLVNNYSPSIGEGISVIRTILDAVKAQDTALWSVSSILSELDFKVLKSPQIATNDPSLVRKTISEAKAVLSTQSMIGISNDEEILRVSSSINQGIKDMLDFIMDNLSGYSRMPKSKLMGQAQGVITAGQYDLMSYYDNISRYQENQVRPVIDKVISILLKEQNSKLGPVDPKTDFQIKFNPLWKIDPLSVADKELKEAQRDKIYYDCTVLQPDEIKRERFKNLKAFHLDSEESIDFYLKSTQNQEA
jgi:uncharacterized protein